jgi:hypothetical protein
MQRAIEYNNPTAIYARKKTGRNLVSRGLPDERGLLSCALE